MTLDGQGYVDTPDPISNSEVKNVHVPAGTALMCGRTGKLSTFSFLIKIS